MATAPIKYLPFQRFGQDRNRPTIVGASYTDILKGRLRRLFGALLNSLRIPGTICDCQLVDPVTHQTLTIRVGILFSRITFNGRDYYFHRITGKYDGTGMGCS